MSAPSEVEKFPKRCYRQHLGHPTESESPFLYRAEVKSRFLFSLLDAGPERIVGPTTWTGIYFVNWVSDGSALVAAGRPSSQSSSQIWKISYPDGHVRRITNDDSSYSQIAITPDSKILTAIRHQSISNLEIADGRELASGRAGTHVHQLTPGGDSLGGGGIGWLSDGRLALRSVRMSRWSISTAVARHRST
jgi:hypothetical protein